MNTPEKDEQLKEIFAANLKAKMVQLGLTHREMADLLGVPRRRFRTWVYEERYPSREDLILITEKLQIDDLYLFLIKKCA